MVRIEYQQHHLYYVVSILFNSSSLTKSGYVCQRFIDFKFTSVLRRGSDRYNKQLNYLLTHYGKFDSSVKNIMIDHHFNKSHTGPRKL